MCVCVFGGFGFAVCVFWGGVWEGRVCACVRGGGWGLQPLYHPPTSTTVTHTQFITAILSD